MSNRVRGWRAFAVAVVAALGACGGDPRPPSIVLVTLDTVRADHTSCYGYARRTTPELDRLAAAADRYTNALSTAPWTVPSHASIFTGRYPFEHGADATDHAPPDATQNSAPLAASHTTLAEALAARGYATGAFVANAAFLGQRFGFAQGFDTYEVLRASGVDVTTRIKPWLDAHRERPFLLFVNYMDAHRPYNVAPIADASARGLPAPSSEHPGRLLDRLIDQVMGEQREPDPALLAQVIDQYDTGIANADFALGQLLAHLRQLDLFDDCLVIVTSDHGEYFGEHRLVEHNKDVYQAALRVPLVVKRPGQDQGRVVDQPTSHAELAGLVVGQLPAETRAGLEALFPRVPGATQRLAELRYSRPNELAAPWGARFKRIRQALIAEPWKYIRSSDGADELYDLARDPDETRNVIAIHPEVARDLRARLEAFLATGRVASDGSRAVELDEDELDVLRKLGY